MLLVMIHNDGSGKEGYANYNCAVRITTAPDVLATLWEGRVEGHRRSEGFESLINKVNSKIQKDKKARVKKLLGIALKKATKYADKKVQGS